jgi:hypothetical protein
MALWHKDATNIFDTMILGPMDTVTRLDIAPPLELQKRRSVVGSLRRSVFGLYDPMTL